MGVGEISFQVHQTRRGPLIIRKNGESAEMIADGPNLRPKADISFQWTGMKEDSNMLQQMMKYPDVRSAEEFKNTVLNQDGAPLYFVYADTDNNFGFAPGGACPRRPDIYKGGKISAGYLNENEWTGYLNADEKPYLFNPKKGFASTANNRLSSMNTRYSVANHATVTA